MLQRRKHVHEQTFELEHKHTEQMLMDPFFKVLSPNVFKKYITGMLVYMV
jgi:hypothetical protein